MLKVQPIVEPPVRSSPAPTTRDQSDSELRYLLLAAQREGSRQMAGQLRPLNLTPAQAEILLVLSQRAPLTLAEVGRLIVCENHSPSRIVDTLVKRGLVHREPGQVDRRVVYLRMTPQGEELLPELRQIDAAMDAMAGDRLSPHEKQIMTDALRKTISETPSGVALSQRFPHND
jgi:DNA-binding MarR family transcriptional regulator